MVPGVGFGDRCAHQEHPSPGRKGDLPAAIAPVDAEIEVVPRRLRAIREQVAAAIGMKGRRGEPPTDGTCGIAGWQTGIGRTDPGLRMIKPVGSATYTLGHPGRTVDNPRASESGKVHHHATIIPIEPVMQHQAIQKHRVNPTGLDRHDRGGDRNRIITPDGPVGRHSAQGQRGHTGRKKPHHAHPTQRTPR